MLHEHTDVDYGIRIITRRCRFIGRGQTIIPCQYLILSDKQLLFFRLYVKYDRLCNLAGLRAIAILYILNVEFGLNKTILLCFFIFSFFFPITSTVDVDINLYIEDNISG